MVRHEGASSVDGRGDPDKGARADLFQRNTVQAVVHSRPTQLELQRGRRKAAPRSGRQQADGGLDESVDSSEERAVHRRWARARSSSRSWSAGGRQRSGESASKGLGWRRDAGHRSNRGIPLVQAEASGSAVSELQFVAVCLFVSSDGRLDRRGALYLAVVGTSPRRARS